jgi:hypothetical protein
MTYSDTRRRRRAKEYRQRVKRRKQEAKLMAANEPKVLVARRMLTAGNRKYPAGSIVPEGAVPAKNLQSWLNSHSARYESKTDRVYPAPIDIEPSPPPPPRPKVILVEDKNPTEAWRLSLEAYTRIVGSQQLAEDLILASGPEARDLYKRAVYAETQARASRQGVVSVTPNF